MNIVKYLKLINNLSLGLALLILRIRDTRYLLDLKMLIMTCGNPIKYKFQNAFNSFIEISYERN